MPNNKSYRIKINEGEEYVDINLNVNQDIDMFEMLSLKVNSKNFYKLQSSNYGCVAGRVLANNAIGVPNVKLSIFIAADEDTKSNSVLNALYPYSNTFDKNEEGVKYNLLTEEQISECQKTAGTFPSKRLVLDDGNVFEIFDKYYKFTTTTNFAGDYMIFGVPVGVQTLYMNVDLSNIGSLLSQTPRDFIYKGYDKNLFENPEQFKTSNDLDSLPQIISQNESVYVYPFWGDSSEMKENNSNGVRISRKDINLSYKFEPTCVFFGSIVSDEKSNGFSEKCIPTDRMGRMDKLTTGEGTIEMIRKTPDGETESYNIGGTHLIDGDGTWCYQIPMNLDFIRSDENGNIVPSDDPNKGLPTRTRVRFRFSLNDFASDYESNHLCKMLVPNNPTEYAQQDVETRACDNYAFGTRTRDDDFRDLLWNKVYSVKSYIPRIQKSDFNKEKRFSGFKTVNVNASNNPIPYNNIRIDITFMFILQCAIMHTLIWITSVYNKLLSFLIHVLKTIDSYDNYTDYSKFTCLTIGDGACPDLEGWYFAPGCSKEVDDVPLINQTMIYIDEKENGHMPNSKVWKECPNCSGHGRICYERIFDPDTGEWIETGIRVNCIGYPCDEGGCYSKACDMCSGNGGWYEYNEAYGDTESINYQNDDFKEKVCVTARIDYFVKCIELALAKEYEVIQFDFYNDWMNGMLYIPRWFASVKKARSLFFGLIKTKKRVRGCMETTFNKFRRYTQQCSLNYDITKNGTDVSGVTINNVYGCIDGRKVQNCHKKNGRNKIRIFKNSVWAPGNGIVHPQATSKEQYAYYFRPRDFSKLNDTFVTFFATDIVLLGSLSHNDLDGIPYISELISSSYKMPTNLAATNMDIVGPLFAGKIQNSVYAGYSVCNEEYIGENDPHGNYTYSSTTLVVSGVTVQPNTFEAFKEVYENTGIDTDYDLTEYPLTEASGIDWGYYGPEQDIILFSAGTRDNTHFEPGGHFLGLSCFNAETNIKSCVNLSRICEIGVNMSRRKPVESSNNSDLYVIPTGLISDFDIYDGDFRSVFATLNHNELHTVKDDVTGRYKYDILPMYMGGFDGSMQTGINEWRNRTYHDSIAGNSRYLYSYTSESFDKNYYDFRMGLNNYRNRYFENVYAISKTVNNNKYYSLPMYNNSFYFYFGLHDGATALDKFHEKFYGGCNTVD